MTVTDPVSTSLDAYNAADLQQKAKDHLWMAFARQSAMEKDGVTTVK